MVNILTINSSKTVRTKAKMNIERIKSLANSLPAGFGLREVTDSNYCGYDSQIWTNLYISTDGDVEETRGLIFKHTETVRRKVNIAFLGEIWPSNETFAGKAWHWDLYDNSLLGLVKAFAEILEKAMNVYIIINQTI